MNISRRPATLAGRLAKTLIVWVGAVWLLCLMAVVWYTDREINYNFDNELVEISHRMFDIALDPMEDARSQGDTRTPLIIASPGTFADAEVYYRLLTPDTKELARSAEASPAMFDVPLVPGFANSRQWRVYTQLHPKIGIYLQVADPLDERSETVNRTLLGLIVPFIVLLPALSLVLYRIARSELEVLDNLSREIALRDGRQLEPIHLETSPHEIQRVQEHVNRLLERLSQSLDVERALAANAAHELRTPLTAARLRLQTALDHGLNRSDVEAALESLQTLSHRTEKLLQLSRAESSAPFTHENVDLVELANTVLREFWQDEQASERLDLITPSPAELLSRPSVCKGDVDALAIVLRNLVENALSYAESGTVDIIVGPGCELAVRDQGRGVSPEKLEKLKKRHVRQSALRTGYGLGLSIVSSIAQKHDAELILTSPLPGQDFGFEARLILQPAN